MQHLGTQYSVYMVKSRTQIFPIIDFSYNSMQSDEVGQSFI